MSDLTTSKSFLFSSIYFLNMKKETNFFSVVLMQEPPFSRALTVCDGDYHSD